MTNGAQPPAWMITLLVFNRHVLPHRVQTLCSTGPGAQLRLGDIVIVDNLSGDKGARTLEMIQAACAVLKIPVSHSPNFNRTKNAFSKFKAMLFKAGKRTAYAS